MGNLLNVNVLSVKSLIITVCVNLNGFSGVDYKYIILKYSRSIRISYLTPHTLTHREGYYSVICASTDLVTVAKRVGGDYSEFP